LIAKAKNMQVMSMSFYFATLLPGYYQIGDKCKLIDTIISIKILMKPNDLYSIAVLFSCRNLPQHGVVKYG
jgi:hypothetical protein